MKSSTETYRLGLHANHANTRTLTHTHTHMKFVLQNVEHINIVLQQLAQSSVIYPVMGPPTGELRLLATP